MNRKPLYPDVPPKSLADSRRLLHELCVNQTELQAQNEELRLIQAELERVRSNYCDLYDFAPVGYCSVSAEGVLLQANLTLATQLESVREGLLGQAFSTFIVAADQDIYSLMRSQLLGGDLPQNCELRLQRHLSGPLWVQLSAAVALDGEGGALLRLAISDISARKLAEEALRRREQFTRDIANNLPGLVGYWTADLRCGFANLGYQQWFGRSPEEMLGISLQTLLGNDMFERNQPHLQAVLAGESQRFERTFTRVDGQTGDFLVQYISDCSGGQVQGFFALLTDITSVRQGQEQLRLSEARQGALLKAIPDLIFVNRRDGEYLEVHAADPATLFVAPQEILQRRPSDLLPAAVAGDLMEAFAAALQSGQVQELSYALVLNGETKYFEARVAPSGDDQLVTIVRDISARQQSTLALRASEQHLRTIIDSEPECVKLISPQGELLDINAAGLAMLEACSLAEAKAQPLLSYVEPSDRAAFKALHERVMGGEKGSLAFELVGLHGARRSMETCAAPLRDADGQVSMVLTVTRDVTERKRAEMALRESEYRWQFAIDGSGDGLWDWDVSNGKAFFSPRWKSMLGYAEEEVGDAQDEWRKRVHPDDLPGVLVDVQAHLDGARESYCCEYRMRGKDDQWIWILARGLVVSRDAAGHALRMIGTHSDISLRKRNEQALQASLRDREVLLKEVHHRVKNNLQVISSLLRLEGSRSTAPETRTTLGDMQGRIHAMAVLHEALYRSGRFTVVDLGLYLKQLATQSFRSHVGGQGNVQLRLQLDSAEVTMDQAMPCGLLVNELLSNCLKHAFADGRTGEVCVQLQARDGGRQLCLQVSDNGAGMPQGFVLERSQSLGLQLVFDLIVQLGGNLEIGQGPGAHFSVSFAANRL